MKTLTFSISFNNDKDKDSLKFLQHQGSIDFRKCYNNLDLLADKSFLQSLNIQASKYQEYLKTEVIVFHERRESSKEKILTKINELLDKQNNLTPKEFEKLTSLKKSYNSNVVFGGKKNLQNLNKGLISKNEWKDKRLYPLTFYGDSYNKGNRFFDFKNISEGKIIFKLNKQTKIPLKISNKKHKKEIKLLEILSNDRQIPITVKLTYKKIYISFDESILYNSKLDIQKLHKTCPYEKGTDIRKEWYKQKFKEHQSYLKEGKLERYLSIDLNPNQIGFVITDNEMNLIDKGCFELDLPKATKYSNKRKYEYSIIVKQLFKLIKHYRCSYLVIEDLEKIVKEDHGNKKSNRKIKSEWKLNYLKQLIQRRCNETKTILVEVSPVYSSFIGNLNYNLYDPIASAMEICRRGINKYVKGFKWIPDFNLDNIMTDSIQRLNALIDDSIDLNEIKSYNEAFKSIRNKSYRRKEKSFLRYLSDQKSCVKLYI